MTIRHAIVDTSVGDVTLVADGHVLTGLHFWHQVDRPAAATWGPRVDAATDEVLAQAHARLTDYLEGRRRDFDLPMTMNGEPVPERGPRRSRRGQRVYLREARLF
jgi:methylated-DNA-[protein]-cysteine S-methyltransferase